VLVRVANEQQTSTEKFCGERLPQKNFSGKFGEIRAKYLRARTPKNLLAPTPMSAIVGKMRLMISQIF